MRNKISIVFLVSAFLSAFPGPQAEAQIDPPPLNDPPTASSVSILGSPRVGQVLTGSYIYADAENDPQGVATFRWLRGGTPIDGATALTYAQVAADGGALISFEVTPVAQTGTSLGQPVTSDPVGPVVNPPPVATNVLILGTPQVGQVLTGSYIYADAENDPQGVSTFRWLRGGTPIDGAAALTYILGAADERALISFEVTPVAQTGTSLGQPVTSDPVGPVTPPNAPPTASNVLISGTAEVGQVLTASYDYADAENDPQGASTFRWLHTDGEVDTPIDGATDRTYTLVSADEGALIKFEVTPVALSGRSPGLAASAVVGPVVIIPGPDLSTPPTASSVLISGTPRVGQVLTGSYIYADAEGDLQGASIFRWLRDNVAIAGATARSYALVAADEGTLIRFKVTPVAQSGTSPGLAVTSDAVGPVTPAPNDRATASDLELISLKATPELLTVNGQLTYTITVRNNGPAAATGVHVIDALPPAATPVPAGAPADSSQGQCTSTPSSGPQPQALTVDCDLETLAPGAEATVTINVMPTVTGDLINTAQVAAFETDPNPANNSKTETTLVRLPDPAEADLAITAVVDPRANGFTYSLTVTNNGPATATGVQLTNDLPRGLDQITASQGDCSVTDPMLCALGTLTSGADVIVRIGVILTGGDTDTLPNRAAVNGKQHDPNTANNFALTSALELPRPQTACNSTRCTLRLTCNRSGLLGGICRNQIKLFIDTRARRDTDARRLSEERAARPRRVPFAAAVTNLPGDKTKNVRLQLTPNGKKLAPTLRRQGKIKLRGMMEISNHVGGRGIDIIPLTLRLK